MNTTRPTDARITVPAKPEPGNALQRAHFHLLTQQLLEAILIIHTAPEYSADVLASIRGHMDSSFKIAASYRMPYNFTPSTSRYHQPFPALIHTVRHVQDMTRHLAFAEASTTVGRMYLLLVDVLDEINPREFARWREEHGV
jgi:negative regulator of replication initiation